MHSRKLLFVMLAGTLLVTGATKYKVVARYPVAGDGGFDYVGIDSAARRLYISHATQVDVVDVDNGRVAGSIPDTPGVHGAVVVPAFQQGFTSNGAKTRYRFSSPRR